VDKTMASWYALRTRSRHEKRVQDQLQARGIEPFLPLVERWRQWKDRRKLVAFPLFSGYCFARFSLTERVAVPSTLGVVQIVGNQEGPIPVAEAEVEAVVLLMGGPNLFGRLHGSLVFGATSVGETCFRRRSGCYARPLTPGLSLAGGTERRSR